MNYIADQEQYSKLLTKDEYRIFTEYLDDNYEEHTDEFLQEQNPNCDIIKLPESIEDIYSSKTIEEAERRFGSAIAPLSDPARQAARDRFYQQSAVDSDPTVIQPPPIYKKGFKMPGFGKRKK